jgi:hypothetical protein
MAYPPNSSAHAKSMLLCVSETEDWNVAQFHNSGKNKVFTPTITMIRAQGTRHTEGIPPYPAVDT